MGKIGKQASQTGARLRCFNTIVRHKTDCYRSIFYAISQRAGNRRNVFECISHFGNIRIRCIRSHSHNISKSAAVFRRHSKRCQCVRYNIGRSSKIFSRGGRQGHKTFDTVHHLFCVPACLSHVLKSFCRFRSSKLRDSSHLIRLFSQLSKFLACSA